MRLKSMSKLVYPIILHPETEGGYSVSVPDLNIGTQGETVAECIDMARDAIGLWGICEQDEKRPIPEPSSLTPTHSEGEIVTLVDIDFDAYRHACRKFDYTKWREQALDDGLSVRQLSQKAILYSKNM